MKTIADCELRIANLQKKRPAPASIRNPQSAIRNGLFLAGLLVAAVALAAGCESAPAERQAIRLKPSAEARVFQVRAVLLQQRIRPDAPVEDLWRLLGTTGVPYEKRTLWELNDLRMGDGARLAADRLNELATETQDRTAQVGVQFAGENLDFVISLGGERDELDLVWTDAAGRLTGRHFDRAVAQFRVVCRSDPQNPDNVLIALVPEVIYGAEVLRPLRVDPTTTARPRGGYVLADLAAEVSMPAGRLLVLGAQRTSDVSVGGALFYERRGPDLWAQTIILTAERALPGQPAEGGTLPFLPPANTPPKSPAAPGLPAGAHRMPSAAPGTVPAGLSPKSPATPGTPTAPGAPAPVEPPS
jgi:hypothetical protein